MMIFRTLKTQPFHYKVSADGESHQLYSVGRNGVDDDGVVVEPDFSGLEGQYPGDTDLMILYGNRMANHAKEVAEYQAGQAAMAPQPRTGDEDGGELENESGEDSSEDSQSPTEENLPEQSNEDR